MSMGFVRITRRTTVMRNDTGVGFHRLLLEIARAWKWTGAMSCTLLR